jgi:very-short-patch-repair endonuclease
METRHRFNPIILKHAREMRHPQTPAEATLWQHLRNRNLEFKFRRQHPIERFIIDFYCAEVKLCIEIDGDTHLEREQQEYDSARTEVLESIGCSVFRFANNDVRHDINAVAQVILDICSALKSKK